MSRSKNPTRYPSFCFAVAEKLEWTPSKPVVMPCETLREARGLALTFNCWKGAALDAGLESRFDTLKDMVARPKDTDLEGGPRCVILNINTDPSMKRWNEECGLGDLLPEDKPDQPAYMRK